MHPAQRTRNSVVAGGVDNDVEFVVSVCCLDAGGCDALDGGFLDVHQQHVVLVVDLVVPALAGQALGAEHVVLGHQHLGHHGVLYPFADLVAEEFGVVLVGRSGHHHVVEVAEPLGESRLVPQLLVTLYTLFLRYAEGGAGVELVHKGACGLLTLVEYLLVALAYFCLLLLGDGAVAQRGAVVGGTLEDGQVADFLGNFGDELHGGGPGADHTNALARQVHALLGPAPGVNPRTLEVVNALEVRHIVGRKQPDGGDHELPPRLVAVVHGQFPAVGLLVIHAGCHTGIEAYVAAQVELVSDIVKVAFVLGLPRIQFLPMPLFQQLARE